MLHRLARTVRLSALFFLLLGLLALGSFAFVLQPRAALANAAKCPDNYEPNDSFASAWLLFNTTYSAAICTEYDVDYYAFDVPANHHLRAYLIYLPADFDLFLYNSDGVLQGSSTNEGTTEELIDYDSIKGGRYVILAQGKKGAFDPINPYQFGLEAWALPAPTATATTTPTVGPQCPDPYEPNESFAAAWGIAPGDLFSYICERTDQDYFKFEVVPHDNVELWLLDLPGDYDLYLFNPAQSEEARSVTAGTADEYIKMTDAKMAGEYRALVSAKVDSSRDIPYRLRLRITKPATATPTVSPTPPSCRVDPWEPNDSFAAARTIAVGGWSQGLICPPGDRDFYKFAAAAGQTIRLELRSLPADYDLYLWSPSGFEVEHSWNSGTSDELIVYRALGTGEYRAEVRPLLGQWDANDPYDLRPDVFSLTVTPTATPTLTRTATPTATPTPTISPNLDLTIQYIEFNQAIQTEPPMFDPIWFKPTVIRVYISTGLPPGSPCVPHVTVRLDIRDEYGGEIVRSLWPYNPGGEICAPVGPDWRNLNNALNFDLPADMLQGSWTLQPYVNYDRSVAEQNYDNNRGMTQVIRFRPIAKRLSIAYVPIHYHPAGYTGPTDPSDRIATAVSYLKATWPLRPDYVNYYRAPIPPIDWTYNVNTDDNDSALLERVTLLQSLMRPQPDHLYGWLPDSAFGGNGLGWLGESYANPAHAAFGNDTYGSPTNSRYRRTMAHELEHNYGFDHPWCTTLNGRGFDVLGRQVKPDSMLAVMCAGQPEHVAWADRASYGSKYIAWDTGLSALEAAAEPATQPSAPTHYVIISGRVCVRQGAVSGTLSPLQHVVYSEAIAPPAGSAYCLDFRKADGTLLQTRCFIPAISRDSAGVPECTPFAYTLLWPEGATRVALRQGQTVLAERQASAHEPTVQVLSPNGGEPWDGQQTVTWSAADEDQDALTFSVLFSCDGGVSWLPLMVGLTGTSFPVDTAYLAGGEDCRIKVLVSDGFASAEDTSDAGFTVLRKPPEAIIEAPAEGAAYRPSNQIMLAGQGYDAEDGALAAGRLTWWLWTPTTSQQLGSGSLLSAGPLEAGAHTIVLNVEDADGNVGVAFRTIYVGDRAANSVDLPLILRK